MRLLVYGTLKKGHGNNRLLSGSKLVHSGEFEIKGCQLKAAENSAFPYLYKKFNQKSFPFKGEIYEIDKHTLAYTDSLEGHPSFYTREYNEEYDCYVYVYKHQEVETLDTIYTFLR